MDFYSGKVRLGGSLLNEVMKVGMSAPEVILLRAMHGADAVVALKKTGSRNVDSVQERDRLSAIYGAATDHDGKPFVATLFGPIHNALPTKVPGYRDPDEAPSVDNIVTEGDGDALFA